MSWTSSSSQWPLVSLEVSSCSQFRSKLHDYLIFKAFLSLKYIIYRILFIIEEPYKAIAVLQQQQTRDSRRESWGSSRCCGGQSNQWHHWWRQKHIYLSPMIFLKYWCNILRFILSGSFCKFMTKKGSTHCCLVFPFIDYSNILWMKKVKINPISAGNI